MTVGFIRAKIIVLRLKIFIATVIHLFVSGFILSIIWTSPKEFADIIGWEIHAVLIFVAVVSFFLMFYLLFSLRTPLELPKMLSEQEGNNHFPPPR